MEPGEEPRNKVAAVNEESQKAKGATRISLFAVLLAALVIVVVFGWLWAR